MGAQGFDAAADDAALVRAIGCAAPGTGGDAEAELCRRLGPRVRLYGLRHLREPQAAADLAQQVLMMTIEKLRAGELREPGKLGSFVFGMCRLVVLDLRRGTARREALLQIYGEHEEIAAPETPDPLDAEKLTPCMDGLSERERSVLLLSFFGEKSAGEVGEELGLTAQNTRVIRHRALVRMRDCMGVGELAS